MNDKIPILVLLRFGWLNVVGRLFYTNCPFCTALIDAVKYYTHQKTFLFLLMSMAEHTGGFYD